MSVCVCVCVCVLGWVVCVWVVWGDERGSVCMCICVWASMCACVCVFVRVCERESAQLVPAR